MIFVRIQCELRDDGEKIRNVMHVARVLITDWMSIWLGTIEQYPKAWTVKMFLMELSHWQLKALEVSPHSAPLLHADGTHWTRTRAHRAHRHTQRHTGQYSRAQQHSAWKWMERDSCAVYNLNCFYMVDSVFLEGQPLFKSRVVLPSTISCSLSYQWLLSKNEAKTL